MSECVLPLRQESERTHCHKIMEKNDDTESKRVTQSKKTHQT
jgi:hypothetical protein